MFGRNGNRPARVKRHNAKRLDTGKCTHVSLSSIIVLYLIALTPSAYAPILVGDSVLTVNHIKNPGCGITSKASYGDGATIFRFESSIRNLAFNKSLPINTQYFGSYYLQGGVKFGVGFYWRGIDLPPLLHVQSTSEAGLFVTTFWNDTQFHNYTLIFNNQIPSLPLTIYIDGILQTTYNQPGQIAFSTGGNYSLSTGGGITNVGNIWQEDYHELDNIPGGGAVLNEENWNTDLSAYTVTCPSPNTAFITPIRVATSVEWDREPHIVSSLNTNTLVASYIRGNETSAHVSSCAIRNSVDGGMTWNASTALLGGIFPSTNQTHAAIAVDLNNVFYAICSQNATRTQPTSTIFYKSFDSGINRKIDSTTIAQANLPSTVDKPWIVADTWSTSDYKNSIYTCWSRFNSTYSEILFKKIGPSASAEKVLYRVSRTSTNILLTGCNMAVGPRGEVYVTWIHLLTATDASIEFRWNELGVIDWGWGRVHNVTTLKRFPTTGCPTNSRGLGCLTGSAGSLFNVANDPSIAIDMLGGVHIVYANYSSTAGGEIKYVNSGDCRRDSLVDICSWTSPVTINKDNSNRDQWEPAIHVSSRTNSTNPRGVIHVTVLDRRDDASNIKWRVYDYYCLPATLSTCTSASYWTNVALSDVQIDNAGKDRIGEYHGNTNTNSKDMYTAWTDSRSFSGNGFDIYADWLFK